MSKVITQISETPIIINPTIAQIHLLVQIIV